MPDDTSSPRRLLPNCREVHHLTMKGMDRELSWIERLRVRGHLLICDACTNFSAQMRLMRAAMRQMGLETQDKPKDGRPGERP